ncbi:MAG: histidine--tRNA ligase [Elusimicrobiota bacterium]|jgi:histidyl-tRNA synthetase|nr:histidine--tRNA ligase [Elusimicrobiota bacterium]
MTINAPRGVHDIIGANAFKMTELENNAKFIFARHGFIEARTPIFEDIALFIRSIGEQTDIVSKEMYVFEDKKGKKFALRPEGTASFVRAYIEHRLDMSYPEGKFFYSGEMFRYERPQAGRYRQFHQIGGEFLGNSSPSADAEIIIITADILSSVGIKELSIHINSLGCCNCRPKFRQALIDYFSSIKDLCQDCQIRLEKNPLRLLDCKIDSSKFTNVPKMTDFLCPECKENFSIAQDLLKSAGYKFRVDDKLVRGLDYYNRIVFEIRSSVLGAQDALAGGGRYDNLVKDLGGQPIPAVGFALGSERVILAAQETDFFEKKEKAKKIYIAVADKELIGDAFAFAIRITKQGLKNNKNISVYPPLIDKNFTNQLKFANKINADETIVFAKNEFDNGNLIVKDMKARTQIEIPISEI